MQWLVSSLIVLLLAFTPAYVYADAMVDKAKVYVQTINELYSKYWPEYTMKHIPYGQIEQESSWNVRARLHTSREDGYGLGQITITPRFNNFKTAIQYKALKDWDYKTDPYNPKNQLTFLILQDRDNFRQIARFFINDEERTKGMLVSYNAGYGRVLKRRQAAITQKHKADTWTGGLEDVHDKFEEESLYGRSLYKAVNEYPRLIFKKAQKYTGISK
jgi:hypothetical protein